MTLANIQFIDGVSDDLDRIVDHLVQQKVPDPQQRIDDLMRAIEILEQNPLMGRPVGKDKRELITGRRGRGYVVLYRYVPGAELVLVLGVRSQRQTGYSGP